MGASSPSVVQGLLYSNDEIDERENADISDNDEFAVESKINKIAPNSPTLARISGNKMKDASLPNIKAASTSSGGDTQLFGQFSSGPTSGAKAVSANNFDQAAQEIAKKMWKGYHGASSSSSRKGRSHLAEHSKGHSKGRQLASVGSTGLNDSEDIMKSKWNKFRNGRGIASVSELGNKKTSLFLAICQHYDHYEKTNHIKMGRTSCPSE